MPMNTQTAPSPTSWIAGLVSPTTSEPIPTRAMMPPRTIRRREDSPSSLLWSVRAATGGIRTARRAGLTAEIMVTPIPTTRATITVRDSKTSGPVGRVIPNPLSNASSPIAANTPNPRPTSDATRPNRAASMRTDRNT